MSILAPHCRDTAAARDTTWSWWRGEKCPQLAPFFLSLDLPPLAKPSEKPADTGTWEQQPERSAPYDIQQQRKGKAGMDLRTRTSTLLSPVYRVGHEAQMWLLIAQNHIASISVDFDSRSESESKAWVLAMLYRRSHFSGLVQLPWSGR